MIASALAVPDPRERPLERAAGRRPGPSEVPRRPLRLPVARRAVGILRRPQSRRSSRIAGRSRPAARSSCRSCGSSNGATCTGSWWRRWRRPAGRWPAALPKAFDAPRYALLHKAVLAGLLGNVGVKADADEHYQGARGLKFHLHPGSGLARKGARWILAAELTETSRLYARCAAKIEPDWIEEVAGDRVTRDYFEPHWEEKRGEVVASERVQLYGLTLVARRPGLVRRDRSRGSRARCSSARRSCRARCARAARSSRTTARCRRRRRARAQGAAAGRAGRRRDDRGVLRGARPGRHPLGRRRSSAGAPTSSARSRTRLFLTREYLMRHAASAVTDELFPETLALDGIDAAAQVPLHAGPSARRPHAHGAAAPAQPAARRAAHLARARAWCARR